MSLLALAAALLLLLVPSPASARKIAYPDLQVLMPANDISIVHKSSKRLLEFTHITSDLGEGPLEMRPVYNPETGISQGYQGLYTETSPGVWQFAESVPFAGPMVWTPPSDYNFPLDRFWLLGTNAEGGPGGVVATSPKDLFCMTSDTYVGGVPNTPSENEYPSSACTEPEGRLGLTVGWGDQYEATDGGEGIEITNLPNGTYWLRGEVDPYHYLLESSYSNDITDTKIKIEGETVTVIEQVKPDSTPPTVVLESPAAEANASGTVPLSASANGPATIASVQFLLDGRPIGAPVTSPPYTTSWTVGATSPGRHFLSAQATDSRGFIGTAPDTPINVGARAGSVTIDDVVHETGESAITTPTLSTSEPGELLLAFADSDGPSPGTQSMTVNGAGLTWTLIQRANLEAGDAEIWAATAPGPLSKQTVQASATDSGYHGTLTVAALSGAAGVGVSAAAGELKGPPGIELTSSGIGSVGFATGNDWDAALARTLGSNQEMLYQDLETGTGDTFWTQYTTAAGTGPGQPIVLNDTAPSSDRWNLAAVEVRPASEMPDTEPPTVSIVNPTGGETVSNKVDLSANATDNVGVASVQFYLDGKPLGAPVTKLPYAIKWNTVETTNGHHNLTALATDTSGNTATSSPVEVTVENPAEPGPCFVLDVRTTAQGAKTVTTPRFTTAEAGEQLFAFVSGGGPTGKPQTAKVAGGGVKWRLVRRANSQPGTSEIWAGEAKKALKNKFVKSSLKVKGYDQQLTVIAVEMSAGVGSSAAAGAPGGLAEVSLTTTEAGTLAFAVGNDSSDATARTLASNQVLLSQDLDTAKANTFWSQYQGATTGPIGEVVALADTAPSGDSWNMAAVEVLGDGPGN